MNRNAAVRGLLLGSAAVAAIAAWNADTLPPPRRLRPEILADPVQIAAELPPLRITVAGVDYGIERRFSYDIAGVVVSLHHSDTWWDTAHAEWGDHINLMDVCLAWGDNAAKDTYRDVHFSNTQWECHFETRSNATWQAFRLDQVSNNHLLAGDAQIARRLADIHVGDQVRLRGFLVNYTIYRDGVAQGTRVSSQTRTDTGPGACEVIYLESVEVLDSPGRNWRRLRMIALAALAVGAIAWIRLPVRFDAGED
jgi:hypothetical protein